MAELSGDSVCLDVETIYLGGKVVSYPSFRLLFQLPFVASSFRPIFATAFFVDQRERERERDGVHFGQNWGFQSVFITFRSAFVSVSNLRLHANTFCVFF